MEAMKEVGNFRFQISDFKFFDLSIICLLLISLFANSVFAAEVPKLTISEVKIVGNRTVTDGEVLDKIRSRSGQAFSADVAESDAKRVAELSGVEYSYYSTKVSSDQMELTFVVVERNLVRAIVFVGNEAYKSGQFISKLDFKLGDFLDALQVKNGSEALEDFYKKKGYPYVKVSLDPQKISEGRVIYTIEEGPRVKYPMLSLWVIMTSKISI